MTRYLTVLLCITGVAAAACAKDKPAESAYDTTERPADERPLTPASSDALDNSRLDSSDDPADRNPAGSTSVAPDRTTEPDTLPQQRDTNAAGDTTRSAAPSTGSDKHAADNTGRNERDRSSSAVTPMDQGNSQADLDITQRIRKAVMKDDSLSFTAKNVKIITRDGKVMLRGTVSTNEERLAIETAAKSAAGAANVQSELEVKK
jgi:osmotically-inducible protein OsmY